MNSETQRDTQIKIRALKAAGFGVGMTDLEGRLTYVNDAVVRMWGFDSEDELLGRPLPDFWHGDQVFETMRLLREEGAASGEDIGKRKDGSLFPIQFVASVVTDDNGVPLCTIGSFVDITGKQKAEDEHRQLESQIQKAQKLESLAVLAGGVAHDFNNILMGVLGNADMAMHDLAPESPVRPFVVEIINAAKRAADLARQMLAYSGKGRVVVELLDLGALVEEISNLIEASISKDVVIEFDFVSGVPPVEGDATQLRQIVINLITNASEAITGKGIVRVSTGSSKCDRAYLSSTFVDDNLPEGDYSYFEVSDSGSGMAEEIRAKIFDPFFSTKFVGRGLGLAAVLGIVRGHKGAIEVNSQLGHGTSFKVLFPATKSPPAFRQTSALAPAERCSGTILLVDDEQTVRSVGRQMLERLGLDVVTACDGLEAIRLFEADPERYDCVLLDLTMPKMGGEDCLRALRRIRSDVRVILSSGYVEEVAVDRFDGLGISGFIQKPYQYATLAETLEAARIASETPDKS